MSHSVHNDNNIKDILIIGPAQDLDYTALIVEVQYSNNCWRSSKKFCLSLHHNRNNSFVFPNATEIYQLKGYDSIIKKHPLGLEKYFRKFFSQKNERKTGLNGCVYNFSIDS